MEGRDSLADIRQSIQDVLNLPNRDLPIVDFVVCLAVINTWSADVEPVWGFVVGPPGSAKTEVLRTLEGWPFARFVDELTENSLASGYEDDEGNDPSLLPQLNGKILIMRDFSSLTGTHRDTLTKVLGVLRAAYDGTYTKSSGKAGPRSYAARFGVVIATTPVFDAVLADNQQLGERFVAFRMMRGEPSLADRMALLAHVQTRMEHKTAWRAALRTHVQASITAIRQRVQHCKPTDVFLTDDQSLLLRMMADMVCRLRTRPHKDAPGEAEVASRFVQQITNLALARAACSGRSSCNDGDIAFARRLSLDSLPDASYRVMSAIYHTNPLVGHRIVDLAHIARLPMDTVSSLLHQYNYLHIVSAVEGRGATTYCLEDETLAQIAATSLFKPPPPKLATEATRWP